MRTPHTVAASIVRSLFHRCIIMLMLMLMLVLCGCATTRPWVNTPAFSPPTRSVEVQPATKQGGLVLGLTVSGGGARAAAFGLGVMEELRQTEVVLHGRRTNLMSETSLISGVSGGSILAAHYAAFGDATFERFAPDFLESNLQGKLQSQLLNPAALRRLASPWYGRAHLLADRLDALYQGATFGDIAKRPDAPQLLVSATDLKSGMPFEFSPEQLSMLCTDWRSVPLSFAVAASAAVPILLTPMRLENHAAACADPPLLTEQSTRRKDFRVRMLRQQARQYRDPARHPNLHLVDGGLSDNLGLRTLLDGMIASGHLADSFADADAGSIDTLALIVINAERDPAAAIEANGEVPGIAAVTDTLLFGAGSREAKVTLGLLADDTRRWREELQRERQRPGSPFSADAELHVITVTLREIADRSVRRTALQVATRFSLPAAEVALLRRAGREVLVQDPDFQRLRQRLSETAPGPTTSVP